MQLGGQATLKMLFPTQVKGSDPKLRPCQTTQLLSQEFVLILLFLAGANRIFIVKDKAQTQLQRLQQPQPSSVPFTDDPLLPQALFSAVQECSVLPPPSWHSLFQHGRCLLQPVPSERHLQQSFSSTAPESLLQLPAPSWERRLKAIP